MSCLLKITRMKRFQIMLGLCFFIQIAWGQYATLKSYQKEVAKYEAQKDYPAAYEYYKAMIEFDKDPELYHYKAAQMAMEMKAFKTADSHLAHLDTLELGEQFKDINYYRGVAAHKMGRYDEAIVFYNIYISESEDDENELVEDSRKRIEFADWANFQKPDTLVNIEHLGETINSPYSDFGATELGDKDFLYSTDRALIKRDNYPTRRKISHVYYSPDGNSASQIPGEINKKDQHSSNTTFSPDRSKLFYTLCEFKEKSTEIRCDIYVRDFDVDSLRYGPAKKLPEGVNRSGYSTTQPNCATLPTGEMALFFASDRPGGKGETDLYFSIIDTTGRYGDPISLDSLNTEKSEWSPFFHEGDQDLYFSSDGYLGFGSLDIYRADWTGEWTENPTNVGSPINSSYDDVYYALNESGDFAFMASNRDGAYFIDSELEACCFDLYKAHHVPPKMDLLVKVYDKFDTTDILESTITLIDLESGIPLGEITSNDWDDYNFQIEHFKEYRLISNKLGYLPDTLDFNTNDQRGIEILEHSLYMDKIVPLHVTVWDENTGEPINGALVKLFDTSEDTIVLLAETSNPVSHEYNFDLIRGRSYELFGTKNPKYDSATVLVTQIETSRGDSLEKEIDLVQLAIRRLEKVFPLILYFDNDQPNPATKRATTDRIYHDTYEEYMARKDEFIEKYTKNLGGSSYGQRAEGEIKGFFKDDVEHGYNKLNYFMEQLLGVLEGGLLVEVSIKGYTSPIAKGDYNLKLGKRRVQCLKNEFLDWNGGILMEYARIGKLVLKEISFGETKAPIGLSDSALDKRNSVYSPLASKERRVEVIAVRRMAREAKVNLN